MPEAAISGRHVVAQASGEPSANSAKRMGDELSALPATGSSGPDRDSAVPIIGASASARHADASVLGNERDNPNPCHAGIGALPKCFGSVLPRRERAVRITWLKAVSGARREAARDLLLSAPHTT